jgi:hypothetical protein
MRAGIFGHLELGRPQSDPMRRALQDAYLERLIALYERPDSAAPSDARELARAELVWLEPRAGRAAERASDRATRAHLELLEARARRALAPAQP